jgi:4-hydroxybenzoate polyprenyltransferase
LIWEISRKPRAPQEENDYTTYPKIFGYKKANEILLFL